MSTQSGKAMKMSGEAARNCLPGLPHFLLPPPIIYFDNLMTGFVNCNKKIPAIKTELSDAVFARLRRRAKSVKGGNEEKCKR